MVTGRGLDLWSALPVLGAIPLIGLVLRANKNGRDAYAEHGGSRGIPASGQLGEATPRRRRRVAAARRSSRPRNAQLRRQRRPAAAGRRRLCPRTCSWPRSVTACCWPPAASIPAPATRCSTDARPRRLTWAMERLAWRLTRITRFWDPDYYRTYTEEPGQPGGYMSVQSEVTRALKDPTDFCDVARGSPHWWLKSSGMVRDTATDSRPGIRRRRRQLCVGALAGRHPHLRNGVCRDKLTAQTS